MWPDVNIQYAVRVDQALHGTRFIRLEFTGTVLFCVALAGLTIRFLLTSSSMLLDGVVLVVLIGIGANHLALPWLSRGPLQSIPAASNRELQSMMWRFSVLVLLLGAVALAAWRQRHKRA